VYFSKNILTEAANQTLSPLGLPIVLEFNTDLGSGTTVTIPLKGTVDVVVSWGDGFISNYSTAGDYAHTYATPGVYTVTISGTLTGYGSSIADNSMLSACLSWGNTGLTDVSYAFYNASNLVLVPANIPATVTNTSYMFAGASSFNSDISTWNTRSITNMESMFDGATTFNIDISAWDVSSVTNMNSMFNGATTFNQNLSNWCVTSIPVEPTDFSTGSALTIGNIPVWGTCPDN
jgi:surface protein